MERAIDRFLLLIETEGVKFPWLERNTGIGSTRWNSVKRRTVEMRASEIEALAKLWPEYAYWLTTGKEIPEVGQISPITKKAQRGITT
jgi:hypothetical protein|tara:strand:- start:33 stop:296 length:264 start_codon:yes stop_codon:yes gene_type:complete